MPDDAADPIYRCLARAVGSRDEWAEVRVHARSQIQLDAILRRRGIEPMAGSAELIWDGPERRPPPGSGPSSEAELRSIAPGLPACWECGASLDGRELDQGTVRCRACDHDNPIIEYRPDPLATPRRQAHAASPFHACPSCGYDLRGQRVTDGGVRCPECGSVAIVMVRERAMSGTPNANGPLDVEILLRDQLTVRCRACTYPLAQIPPVIQGPDRAHIECPECGEQNQVSILTTRQLKDLSRPTSSTWRHGRGDKRTIEFTAVIMLLVLSPFTNLLPWLVTLPLSGAMIARWGPSGWWLIAGHAIALFSMILFWVLVL